MMHGELFAGIGGFSLGAQQSGISTPWAVEINAQCRRVLRHHHPEMKLHQDVCDVGSNELEPVDIITFGSPCQDLSVAGKQRGFSGERSGLFYEAVRIVSELRPDIAIWENVPGAFSSNGGRDFGAAIDALADIGALDIAWRVLDAQYFGVPQRRRRIFLVADFRGERAKEILFESESMPGDIETSQETQRGITERSERGASQTSERGQVATIADCLTVGANQLYGFPGQAIPIQNSAYTRSGDSSPGIKRASSGVASEGEHRFTLTSAGQPHAIATSRYQGDRVIRNTGVWPTLSVATPNNGGGGGALLFEHSEMDVRKLTPLECSRLQGFPDGWLDLDPPLSETAKYRMLGNAVAVPVTAWIMQRISEVL